MNPRTTRIVVVLGAFVVALVLALGVILMVTDRAPLTSTQGSAIGGPFKLTAENGQPITDQDFKGKPFLVFFGYTHCPDICPTTLFELSEILRALGPDADKVNALFVSVDPNRDTPAILKSYLSSFDPHLRGATGSLDNIRAMAKEYRAFFAKVAAKDGSDDYTMDHTALVYLMDRNGKFVAPFNTKRPPEQSAADLRRYF